MHGMGRNLAGAKADDVTLKVPAGTQVYDEDDETLICDLAKVGDRFRLAKGGNGGFGNAHFKTSTNQAPRRANPGQEGQERTIWLRLKLIADAGLVGLPNAGKSTFLASVTAARPKIANYPFTTLHPNLGVASIDGREFIIADIPGLIEGHMKASVWVTASLAMSSAPAFCCISFSAQEEDVAKAYKTVRKELKAYGGELTDKPEIVALSQVDTIDDETREAKLAALKKACKKTPLAISGVSREGLDVALRKLALEISISKQDEIEVKPDPRWQD